ncbi:MAG: hypothetical protein JWL92_240 [Candidatus Nomurabacteria bacterium]|nr:hypothetical protein [Candidatus Nomurabacteria bacterium]
MAMKLYDVIRKEHKDKGIVDPEPMPTMWKGSYDEVAEKHHAADDRPMARWKKMAVIACALIFIGLLYMAGVKFVHASVTITERRIPFSLFNTQLEVANEKTADEGRLSFQTMVVTDTVTRQVFGSAITTSTTKATGSAVVFNAYSTKGVSIKAGTTFTGVNGKKYVTKAAVSVPGYTLNGKVKVAGSASVSLVAADVGPTYNSDGTSFTISGWTGANAKLVYATSAGALNGGQNGAVHTLTEADRAQAMVTLQGALQEKLARETRSQIPDNLVTFPDLQFTSVDNNSLILQGNTIQFPATLKGTMVSYLIPRKSLEQAIARKAIADHLYPDVTIPDLGAIQIEPVSVLPADPKNIPSSITISVSGQGTIITKAPVDTIQQSLLGASHDQFKAVISAVPEIDTAQYSLMPFWAPYFPYQADRIKVQIK